MAVSITNTGIYYNVTGVSGSMTLSGTSRALAVAVNSCKTATSGIDSVTINGITMDRVEVTTLDNGITDHRMSIHYLLDADLPSNGTYTLTFVPSVGNIREVAMVAYCLSGVAQQEVTNVRCFDDTDLVINGNFEAIETPLEDDLILQWSHNQETTSYGTINNGFTELVGDTDVGNYVRFVSGYGNTTNTHLGWSAPGISLFCSGYIAVPALQKTGNMFLGAKS